MKNKKKIIEKTSGIRHAFKRAKLVSSNILAIEFYFSHRQMFDAWLNSFIRELSRIFRCRFREQVPGAQIAPS
jgi:hypothetical protein